MSDFDIKILLAEAKDDPRFQKITTNTLRMGSTALSNDPIVAGVSGGNAPLLFNVASNVPGLFDVVLDIFILLKEEITETLTVSDIFEKTHEKGLKDIFNIVDDKFLLEYKTIKKSVIEAVSRFTLEQQKSLLSVFEVADLIEDLTSKRQYKEAIGSIAKVKKLVKQEFHNEPSSADGYSYNRLLALEFARKTYEYVNDVLGYNVTFGHTLPNNSFPATGMYLTDYQGNKAGDYFSPTSRSHFYEGIPPGNGFPTASIQYHDWPLPTDQFAYLRGMWPVYDGIELRPFWKNGPNPPYHNNNAGGYVYWWMPDYINYYNQFYHNRVNTRDIKLMWYRKENPNVIGVPNGWFLKDNYGTPSETDTIFKQEYDNSYYETFYSPGSKAAFEDHGVKIQQNRPLANQILETTINAIVAKERSLRSRVSFDEDVLFDFGTNLETKIEFDDNLQDQLDKRIRSIIEIKNLILTPKAAMAVSRFKSISRLSFGFENTLPTQFLKGIDFIAKDTTINESIDKIEIKNNLLIDPSRFLFTSDKVNLGTEQKLKVSTNKASKVEADDREFFKMSKTLYEDFQHKDTLLNVAKARIEKEKIDTLSAKQLKVSKPVINYLDTHSSTALGPGQFTSNLLQTKTSLLSPKSKVETDRVLLFSEVDIEADFKLHISFFVNDKGERIFKFVQKRLPHEDKVESKELVLPVKGVSPVEKLGVISRDRDTGGASDVFFTFSPSIVLEKAFYNDTHFKKKVSKSIENDEVVARINTIIAKLRDLKSNITTSSELEAFKVGKGLIEFLYIDSDERVFLVEKPIKNIIDARDRFLSVPSDFKLNKSKALVKDNFEPLVFRKLIPEDEIKAKSFASKKTEKNDEGITEFLSSSEKGYAWMRDEEYTRGAYFLEPYVAAIPPGRSRQF